MVVFNRKLNNERAVYRVYESILLSHIDSVPQMAFLAGPRQVGKTTIAQSVLSQQAGVYLNWDILSDRETLLKGPQAVMALQAPKQLGAPPPLTVFDEIHKFKDWKNYLKGFFDQFKQQTRIVVTGSSRLDVFVKGGDSLMGRYFPYTVHPLSVGELLHSAKPERMLYEPTELSSQAWQDLWRYGGFPDPYLKANELYFNQWQNTRHQQFFKEDILDLSQIIDLAQLEVLASLIKGNAGQQMSFAAYAKAIRSTDTTVRRWMDVLESTYYCFRLQPWYKNVARSLRKEPKTYLWDWSLVNDEGAKAENFIACHLQKAVSFWQQVGFGQFSLHYLRDKEKREVDFLIVKDQEPWMLVEVKKSARQGLSQNLAYFQSQVKAPYAFQVVLEGAYVDQSCFSAHEPIVQDPIIVPAKTLLSQLP